MVKDARTCEGCAKPLSLREESRDLAHAADFRRYCERCRLLYCPAPSPTMPVAAGVNVLTKSER